MIEGKWFVIWQTRHPGPRVFTRGAQQLEHALDLKKKSSKMGRKKIKIYLSKKWLIAFYEKKLCQKNIKSEYK